MYNVSHIGFALCEISFPNRNGDKSSTPQTITRSTTTTTQALTNKESEITTETTKESWECETNNSMSGSTETTFKQSTTLKPSTLTPKTTFSTATMTTEDMISTTTPHSRNCTCDPKKLDDISCAEDEEIDIYCECVNCECTWKFYCVKKFFKKIEEMIDKDKEAVKVAETLVVELSRTNLSGGDLLTNVEITSNISTLFLKQSQQKPEVKVTQLTQKIVQSFNFMLDDKNQKAWQSLSPTINTNISEKMLLQLTDLGHLVACEVHKVNERSVHIVEEHIAMESFSINGSISTDFTFPSKSSNITTSSYVHFTSEIVPPSSDVQNCGHSSASGVIYKKLTTKLNQNSTFISNSKLIAFSFTRNSSVKLANNAKIRIRLHHEWEKRRGDISKCMFWHFELNNWSDEGCLVVESTKTFTICECDHLTNFAVLMDISGREEPNDTKAWLSLVCSTLSMICLIITICALITIKTLRSRRSVITTNLCICLLVMNLLTSFGLQQTQNTVLCQTISVMLMYSAASSFLWMLLEGYILYQMIILVFHSVGYMRKRWMFCIGYGVSLVWVSVALAIVKPSGFFDSDKNYFCWISSFERPGLIWIFIGPAFIIIILNVIVFTMSLRATIIANLKKQHSKEVQDSNDVTKPNIKRWLKGWTSLLILLGLTWIIALLYIHANLYFAAYIFIVFNALQGFFIFLFEIALNKKARNAILHEISTKSPLSKTSSSNPLTSVRTKSTSTLSMRNSNESTSRKDSRGGQLNNGYLNNEPQLRTSF
ncbi:Latrophilin-3-like protein [Leptotrombidium deliense]|uniref:Latrophilin-3-like protein n=1 Tax=Leptotrombidium deliense TaxID=299467 RepID=A0A443SNP3_9ACAR|nr:Latrophilin-3-like protein [Leptotrombidium deliense]